MRVISGGQTGSDQAGLRAARRAGIPTGGWAPKKWLTLDGPAPWLVAYGLVESAGGYGTRTDQNVRDSCATVRIAANFYTAGERRTLGAIRRFKHPSFDVVFNATPAENRLRHAGYVHELLRFLAEHDVRVLNVAGNAETTAPGIGEFAEKFLLDVFGRALLLGAGQSKSGADFP